MIAFIATQEKNGNFVLIAPGKIYKLQVTTEFHGAARLTLLFSPGRVTALHGEEWVAEEGLRSDHSIEVPADFSGGQLLLERYDDTRFVTAEHVDLAVPE